MYSADLGPFVECCEYETTWRGIYAVIRHNLVIINYSKSNVINCSSILLLQVEGVVNAFEGEVGDFEAENQPSDFAEDSKKKGEGIKHFLDASKEALLESEREFLSRTLEFLKVKRLALPIYVFV